MNSFNVLKAENKVQGVWIRICTFLRLYILDFIQRNATVFAGLTRAATPFGDSLVSRKQLINKTW
jgi:hypothetical protein